MFLLEFHTKLLSRCGDAWHHKTSFYAGYESTVNFLKYLRIVTFSCEVEFIKHIKLLIHSNHYIYRNK